MADPIIRVEFPRVVRIGGSTDHGTLTGLADDDHPQYHNNARGDARYSLLAHTHTALDLTTLRLRTGDGKFIRLAVSVSNGGAVIEPVVENT